MIKINKYLISLEYNLYGELFAKHIIEKIENDPSNVHRFNEDVIMKYWNDEMTRYTLGKKISYKSKQYGTALFKQYFEKCDIINRALQFINQVSNFSDIKGTGTYAACFGHDDLVMAQLQMVFVFENSQYKALSQMFLDSINTIEINNSYNPFETGNNLADFYSENLQSIDNPYFFNQLDFGQFETNNNLRRLRGL